MKKIAVVRVDYYSNGRILPLGITYDNGEVDYINQILDNKVILTEYGNKIYYIVCRSGEKSICLLYNDYIWEIIDDGQNK